MLVKSGSPAEFRGNETVRNIRGATATYTTAALILALGIAAHAAYFSVQYMREFSKMMPP